jgi:hypothetical protein
MIKIIEIWRKETIPGLPVKFTVGQLPSMIVNNALVPIDGPVISSIVSSMEGEKSKIYRGHCYIISFAESQTKRIIPAGDVVDIAVEDIKKKEGADVPELQP